MSVFPISPGAKPITNEEARAAVETALFEMGLTRLMTVAEKDAFCETAKSSLNYQSNSYRVKEIRLWVESWQSLWLPENLGPPPKTIAMIEAPGKLSFAMVPLRWSLIIVRAFNAWRRP
jgi:hypothetical protein